MIQIASLLVASTALAFVAVEARSPEERPATVEQMLEKATERFEKMDRNGDGYLDETDKPTAAEVFAELDEDGSGAVSKEELKAAPRHARQHRERMMDKMFGRLDADESGELSLSEFEEAHKKRAGRDRKGRMKDADTNGDERISLEEHLAAHQARFAKLDTNGDGQLSDDEWKAAKKRHPHHRGEPDQR